MDPVILRAAPFAARQRWWRQRGTETLRWESSASPGTPLPQDDSREDDSLRRSRNMRCHRIFSTSGGRARPLLGQFLIQPAILFVGAAVRGHHLRPHHALRRDDEVQVVLQCLLKHKSLRLPVRLGYGDELL